ncbi:MAG: iron ABC transporter permease [Mollicutes bacterium]|nr:iron ABC transporter permease [Mollicutes bacterium]MDD7264141.1 iron ABC transporter permease [bacterium]MDY4980106.1 iron ABC transporter permease [Candidatus Onthovivens sp.]
MNKIFKKSLNRSKSFFSEPANFILTIFLCIFLVTTILPLVSIILESFTVHKQETLFYGKPTGSLTTLGWSSLLFTGNYDYSIKYFYKPLGNSLLIALIASFVAILIGGVFAWFICRTNVKWKKVVSALLIFPYIMPSWTIALCWKNIFANTNVPSIGANGFLASVFGIYAPTWLVFGALPIGITLGIHYAPFAYILIGGILKNMDANLEEAATILKTSRARILTKITLPIVAPAMLNTFLLVFASSISAYAVPVFLGTAVDFNTLTTSMKYFNGNKPAQGFAIGILLVCLGLIVMTVNNLLTSKRKSYTTVTGKSGQVSYVDLKKGKYPIAILGMIVVLLISIIPICSFALESLLSTPGDYSSISLDFWIGDANDSVLANKYYNWEGGILRNVTVWKSLGNSLLLSTVCSVIAGTCGLLLGYGIVKKKHSKLSKTVNTLSFIPYLIPSMAFGMAYMAFSVKAGILYGSFLLLAIVGSVKYMPFATKSSTGAMMQLSGEIEEAAILTGTPWWKRMTRVIFPIQKSSFLSGYLLPFISCMRELSLFVFLIIDSNFIVTTLLMYYNEKGYDQYGNALNLLIVIIVLLVNFIINKLTGASIDKGVGGN